MPFDLDSPEWKTLQSTADRLVHGAYQNGISSLTDEERVFFLVWIADGEVVNGGMHAVCCNTTGDYLPLFPDAFRAIGAPHKASTFEQLIQAFGPDDPPSTDFDEREEQHEELPREAVEIIDGLDDAYYSTPEPIVELLYEWCKRIQGE